MVRKVAFSIMGLGLLLLALTLVFSPESFDSSLGVSVSASLIIAVAVTLPGPSDRNLKRALLCMRVIVILFMVGFILQSQNAYMEMIPRMIGVAILCGLTAVFFV